MPNPQSLPQPDVDFMGFLQGTHLNKGCVQNETGGDDIPASESKPRVIAFGCTSSGLVITIKRGRVYFKGVLKSVASWPSLNKVTITATRYGYISIDLTNGNPTWHDSATDPGSGTDTTEIWMIFVASVTDGKITELLECQHGDIHVMANA